MPDIEDFLPAKPPMLPLPKGLVRMIGMITPEEEIGIGYYGALVGEVFKEYLRKEISYDQFIKETKDIKGMFEKERR